MPLPSETALRGRARSLIEAMTDRARWIYAVPREADGPSAGEAPEGAPGPVSRASFVQARLEAEGLRCEEQDPGARVVRLSSEVPKVAFVLFDSPELEVLLIEASGGDAAPILARVLEKTGFYAQSQLLRTALDVRDPEAPKALKTLAHMVVAWDDDWSDLFLLHLASPDPIARHEAALSVSIASMVSREPGAVVMLLEEAIRRETFPKLRETMLEALNLVQGTTGGPVEIKPDREPVA